MAVVGLDAGEVRRLAGGVGGLGAAGVARVEDGEGLAGRVGLLGEAGFADAPGGKRAASGSEAGRWGRLAAAALFEHGLGFGSGHFF